MSAVSSIEWTDRTWNPVRGCSIVSPGCVHCYAMKQAHRFSGGGQPYEGLTKLTKAGPQWTGTIRLVEEALTEPLRWRKPQRVFVNSMSDLFHEGVPDVFIDRVFAVMALASHHTFQILTKRPGRMREYFETFDADGDGQRLHVAMGVLLDGTWIWGAGHRKRIDRGISACLGVDFDEDDEEIAVEKLHWPLPNVWLGVSVENQATANERLPLLVQTPAAVRFVSYEPALAGVDLTPWLRDRDPVADGSLFRAIDAKRTAEANRLLRHGSSQLDWLIVGGESGPGARPFDIAWARSAVEQCRAAGVAVFVKQLGAHVRDRNDAGFDGSSHVYADGPDAGRPVQPTAWPDVIADEDRVEHDLNGTRDCYQGAPVRIHLRDHKGGDPAEWPEALRVRQFPAVRS